MSNHEKCLSEFDAVQAKLRRISDNLDSARSLAVLPGVAILFGVLGGLLIGAWLQ